MLRTLKVLAAIGILAAAGVACSSGSDNGGAIQTPAANSSPCPTPSGTPVKVAANDNLKFSPVHITVKLCQPVDWTMVGTIPHTVTSQSGATFDSGNLNQGARYTRSFPTPGIIHYYCKIHGASVMSGTITVTS
jgi:plastocyanin